MHRRVGPSSVHGRPARRLGRPASSKLECVRCGWPSGEDPTDAEAAEGAEVRCGSMGNRTGDAEADVVDPEGGMTPAPYRGPTAPVLVEPATAAEHSVDAVCLGVVDVPAPLPDVAQHVEQPPGVGLLAAHRVQSSRRVAAVPRDIVELPVPRGAGPGAAGVLPLGLSGKSIAIGGHGPFDALAVAVE